MSETEGGNELEGGDRSQLIFNKWSQLSGGVPGGHAVQPKSEVIGGFAMRRKVNLTNAPPSFRGENLLGWIQKQFAPNKGELVVSFRGFLLRRSPIPHIGWTALTAECLPGRLTCSSYFEVQKRFLLSSRRRWLKMGPR